MRMIDSVYSAYDNDATVCDIDYVQLSELLRAESSSSEQSSSLRIELIKKARQLESNLGIRSACWRRAGGVGTNTESEDESSEKRMMEVVLRHFAHSERNEQLQILDSLLELVNSDCGRGDAA